MASLISSTVSPFSGITPKLDTKTSYFMDRANLLTSPTCFPSRTNSEPIITTTNTVSTPNMGIVIVDDSHITIIIALLADPTDAILILLIW